MALSFQIVNWYTTDIEVEASESDNEDEVPNQDHSKYIIKLFGVDEHGKTMSATVYGFTPHFYVKVQKQWSRFELEKMMAFLKSKMGRYQGRVEVKPMRKKDFWGFTNNEQFWFLRFCFDTHRAMKIASRVITDMPFPIGGQKVFKLYESNIEPFLRFAHIRNIKPAGWITIQQGKYQDSTEILPTKCEVDIQTHWMNVEPLEKDAIAPLLIASFDLECMSSDGDFPVAAKDYQKIATDVYNIYHEQKSKSLDSYEVKAKIIKHIMDTFHNKHIVPKREDIKVDKIQGLLHQHMDHICAIIKGDRTILENSFKDIFTEQFKTGNRAYGKNADEENKRLKVLESKIPKKPEQYIQTYNSKKGEGLTSTGLRRYMNACFNNCFEEFEDIHDRDKEVEEGIEEISKILFGDKDGVINVLTRYLNNVMPPLKGDEIIQIGTTFHRYGSSEVHRKVIFSLGSCENLDGIEVIECETEEDMILEWAQLIESTNPDVITGYNIFGFDYQYIYFRSVELGCMRSFCRTLGRIKEVSDDRVKLGMYKQAKLSSSALGDNLMKYIEMEGRISIDLMKVVQREHKLDSYKLDAVANHFMKQNKHDVSPQDIFRLYRGDAKDRSVIADYCVQDCALCNKLMMKLEIIANNVGMANVCSVPMSWIFMRGQGVKIFSLVAKQCKEDGFLIPVIQKVDKKRSEMTEEEIKEDEEGYEGAIVLEPKTGIYIDTPVSVLDYASLYPSSMISENISHDSIVLDDKYDNMPGVEYLDISYDLYEIEGDEKKKVGEKVCRYVQPADNEKGVIPNILMNLLKQRKLTRKRIGLHKVVMKDGTEYQGFYNKETGKLAELNGNYVMLDKDAVESVADMFNNFEKAVLDGLQLAYKITANSLYGQLGSRMSPLYLKQLAACTTATGRKMIMLAKEYLENNYEADIVYGDSVVGYTPTILRINGEIHIVKFEDIAERFGKSKWKRCVEDGKQEKEACELPGVEVWTEEGWTSVQRIIRHQLASTKKIVRVLTHTAVVDVTDDHSLIKADGKEVSPNDVKIGDHLLHKDFPEMESYPVLGGTETVPISILTAPKGVQHYFWNAFRAHNTGVRSQLDAMVLSILASSIGISISFSTTKDQQNAYTMSITNEPEPHAIRDIYEIKYDGYVYDLTTDNHHFAAGVGNLIVHNTDSVFATFPKQLKTENGALKGKEALKRSIETASEASKGIKGLLKSPHDLEYEKTFYPMILFSKKRYCANKYEFDTEKFKQNSMGIALKRRDNANIVKYIYGGVIDIILNKHDLKESIIFLKKSLKDLIDGKFPLEELVITKTLKAHYKDPDKIAHKMLAERIKERSPGNAPQVNDRIPFVYIQVEGNDKVLQGERIEHPDFIRERKLKPDYAFYLTNQVMNPLLQLYALVLEQLEGYKKTEEHWKDIRNRLGREGRSDKKIKEKVQDLREQEVKSLLFDPFLLKLEHQKTGQRQITDFFSVR
jgi:DNA polymerase elongation subunit (family B)